MVSSHDGKVGERPHQMSQSPPQRGLPPQKPYFQVPSTVGPLLSAGLCHPQPDVAFLPRPGLGRWSPH